MAELTWNRWHRTKGCREWMDKTSFAGASFTEVFYDGMRMLFADEKNRPGLLYQGLVWPASEKVVAANGGKRYQFTVGDQLRFLRRGNFKYADNDFLGPLWPGGELEFSGPDKGELGVANLYAKGDMKKGQVRLHFYNIIKDAQTGSGAFQNGALTPNASGVQQLSAFTAAVMLHEIMHNHGFNHPEKPDWTPGTDYASSLPHVAFRSALDAAKANLPQLGNSSLPLHKVKASDAPT